MKAEQELYEEIWSKKIRRNEKENVMNCRAFFATKYLPDGEKFLDIGCGGGEIAILTKHKYKEIYGVDISDKALEEAKKKGMIVKKINLNYESLPYPENFFDAVVCLDVIEHILDPFHLIKEIRKVLKPGGTLILTTPNFRKIKNILTLILKGRFPKTSGDSTGWDGGHLHYFTYKDIEYILTKYNFKILYRDGLLSREKFFLLKKCLKYFLSRYLFNEFIAGGIIVKAKKT
ncbi:MAG: class I SAM-dependent methyltransferase [Endomicrobiia bacterium]